MQDYATETRIGAHTRVCFSFRGSLYREEGRAVRTDMKRVVIARETVDQSLFGQRLVLDDPVRSAVAWNGYMLRWGCYAVGEWLSRNLCSQVKRCRLAGGKEGWLLHQSQKRKRRSMEYVRTKRRA